MVSLKKMIAPYLLVALMLVTGTPAAALSAPEVTAETAVLIDADTGQVLYDKNMHTLAHPASMTKVMTGLITLEQCSVSETATVSDEAVQIPYNSSHVALTPGEELSVDDAMYALMLPSANDAANVLAEHVAGSQEAFAQLMTSRAREIGAVNTTFQNPHGLSDDNHLTTAYDMALITREAIQNPAFLQYFGSARHTMAPTNRQSQVREFYNQQFMLVPGQWVYNPEIIGGKVGYTDEARHTMTSAARRGDRTLIAVVMGCRVDDKFYDTQTLFDYGFDRFIQAELSMERLTFTTPVTEDGVVVGEATFAPIGEAPPKILLPAGTDAAALEYAYRLPETVEKDMAVDASVAITLPGSAEVLLEIPLDAGVALVDSPVAAMASPGKKESSPLNLQFDARWLLLLVAVPLIPLGWVLIQREKIRRRAERRRQRQERILRERKRYGSY